jgi:hypothetical protein
MGHFAYHYDQSVYMRMMIVRWKSLKTLLIQALAVKKIIRGPKGRPRCLGGYQENFKPSRLGRKTSSAGAELKIQTLDNIFGS